MLVDLGPAAGRRMFTRGMVYGGVMVVGQPRKRTVDQERAAQVIEAQKAAGRRYYAAHREEVRLRQNETRLANKPKCRKWMPIIREECGRRPGHRDSCRSAIVMADEARRRWAGGTRVR